MYDRVGSADPLAELLSLTDDGEWSTDSVLLKVLTANDDSGRHGILVPIESYPLFPPLGAEIAAGEKNPARPIETQWLVGGEWTQRASSFRHYDRYPERRLTSLFPAQVNVEDPRIAVLAKRVGAFAYRCRIERPGSDGWLRALQLLASRDVNPGDLAVLSVGAPGAPSSVFLELLEELEAVAARGWIPTLRAGDTGVGMTLESELGIAANAKKEPDYRGIELKAKRDRRSASRRTLFSKTPQWGALGSRVGLLDAHGSVDSDGRFSIYQSIYAHRESREGWRLEWDGETGQLWVTRYGARVVCWDGAVLAAALASKHRETAFVYAKSRGAGTQEQFHFHRVVHAAGADFGRYLTTLLDGKGCVDFAIHRKENGSVRDHGFLFRIEESELPAVFREVRAYELLGDAAGATGTLDGSRSTGSQDGDSNP